MRLPRKIAISDIHGCLKTFQSLIRDQLSLSKDDHLYLLGDYIDRGRDSKGVIDYILELKDSNHQVTCLKGNHEDLILHSYKGRDPAQVWLRNGGDTTLKSFGVSDIHDIPKEYIDFFEGLEYYAEAETYLLVHAGFNFNISNPLEDRKAMLWIRNYEADEKWLNGRSIVHGHTPQSRELLVNLFEAKARMKINIDCGCVYHSRPGMGSLCAFDLTNDQLYFQKNVDIP